MFQCECDMYLISGAFPENAVQHAFPKKPSLGWCNAEPHLYTAVCRLYAYGNGTSKQTFLLDCYSICETGADGCTGTEIHFSTVLSQNCCQGARSMSDHETRFLIVLEYSFAVLVLCMGEISPVVLHGHIS